MADKANPRRVPATQADVNKALKKGRLEGAEFMFTVCVLALKDKLLVEPEKVSMLGKEIDNTCESIAKGYINYNDIRRAQLDEGYSVHVRG